ncbi:MAG: Gfo/Idh/MocA family oxidoreductase [Clostridia bacterium]|nr:Gfo/Idh/MocA family oxidoreductase [Clostridia bacterium]
MERLKIGFIGLGGRGQGLLSNVLKNFKDVDVVALCDSYTDRVENAVKKVYEANKTTAKAYTEAKELLQDKEVNFVLISASWEAHVPLAIAAMKTGKVTALEVGGAYSIEDCWALVRTYEETKTPFVFLENCCYGKEELLITSMVRKGLFGEISYCHGAYFHDLRAEICGGLKNRHYRLRNYLTRNCDNYPTHNLGPIAKLLNINRGNRMLTLSSFSSKSRGLSEFVKGKEEYAFLQDKHFAQGDVVITNITCADGTLITLKLDTCLPHAYSREFMVSGTKAYYNDCGKVLWLDDKKLNHDIDINVFNNTVNEYEEHLPAIWKSITQEQIDAGHGGMDTLMLEDVFQKALHNEEMPIDVYDAASWMVITALSEQSIAMGGAPVSIPDFTSGNWLMRESKDVIDLS